MWERAQLVHEVRGRDIAVEDIAKEPAQVPIELTRERRIEPQARSRGKVAHQKVPKRLERADRERRHVGQARGAASADGAAGRGLPGIRHFSECGAALRAFAELGAEPGSVEQVQVEPAADRRCVDARVERTKGGLEQVEERRGRDAIRREPIDELGDVPARGDEREIVAHVRVDRASFGTGQYVELTPARELVGGVRQRLRVPGHAARRSPYAFCDDTHFAEMAREEDENPICLGEVVRLEDDRLGTVRARCHVASMVRNGAPSEVRGAYDRSSVGRSLEAHIAAVDEEIRALLTGADPSLQPFYGMMLYHLGLDAERGPSGKRLRPVLCTLVYEALTGDERGALPAAAAIELLHNFTLIHDDIEDQDPARHHRPTVWSVWGVPQAINAGDGMFAVSRLAVQRLRGFPAERVLEFAKLVDEACVRVCEGQFLDISFETRTDVTTERYRAMAAKKTGALFAAAAQGAAVLATDDLSVRETLARFGDAFGQAFQAYDDVLGIWASTERTGKVEMNDLTKRKKTLPVVLGFERAQGKTRERLAALFAPAAPLSTESVEQIREILDDLGVRALIDAEIAAQRGRALHALRGIAPIAAAREPLDLLERLVASATGASTEPAGAVAT
jgi:geranylgeranyl diphosphate synthase, type I